MITGAISLFLCTLSIHTNSKWFVYFLTKRNWPSLLSGSFFAQESVLKVCVYLVCDLYQDLGLSILILTDPLHNLIKLRQNTFGGGTSEFSESVTAKYVPMYVHVCN